jgi:hypothetical protein
MLVILKTCETGDLKETDSRTGKTKALGKIWTFAWFSWCLRLMFEYNIVALSKPVMSSICKKLVELAGRLGKIESVTGVREL